METVARNADLRDEEFETFVTQAESLLNSRPLTLVSNDSQDPVPLCPADFLQMSGVPGDLAPPPQRAEALRHRWRRVQLLAEHLWKRWMRELVPALRAVPKWRSAVENLEPDNLVIVVDKSSPRKFICRPFTAWAQIS